MLVELVWFCGLVDLFYLFCFVFVFAIGDLCCLLYCGYFGACWRGCWYYGGDCLLFISFVVLTLWVFCLTFGVCVFSVFVLSLVVVCCVVCHFCILLLLVCARFAGVLRVFCAFWVCVFVAAVWFWVF